MSSYRIWGRDMVTESERGDIKVAAKIYKMDIRSRLENTEIYGKERSRKR